MIYSMIPARSQAPQCATDEERICSAYTPYGANGVHGVIYPIVPKAEQPWAWRHSSPARCLVASRRAQWAEGILRVRAHSGGRRRGVSWRTRAAPSRWPCGGRTRGQSKTARCRRRGARGPSSSLKRSWQMIDERRFQMASERLHASIVRSIGAGYPAAAGRSGGWPCWSTESHQAPVTISSWYIGSASRVWKGVAAGDQ